MIQRFQATVYGSDPAGMKRDAIDEAQGFYGPGHHVEITSFDVSPHEQRPLPDPERYSRLPEAEQNRLAAEALRGPFKANVFMKVEQTEDLANVEAPHDEVLAAVYAAAVVRILATDETFAGIFEERDAMASLVTFLLRGHQHHPVPSEYVLDDPNIAHWRLARETWEFEHVELQYAGPRPTQGDRDTVFRIGKQLAELNRHCTENHN